MLVQLMLPATGVLLLTFVAGPPGLLYFLLERGLRRPMPYPFDQPRAKKSGRHRQ
jgi:hypothetical protein